MKISLNWLRNYVGLPAEVSVEEIVNKLTFSGLEVEAVKDAGKGFERVFVGEILERAQHPNADRLSLCKISVGNALSPNTEVLEIVCGAQNIKAGDRIPVATLGAIIPNGLEIKAAKIRGVPSSGMLCSADELLLPKPASQKEDGIYQLPADAPIGMNFAKYLGLSDTLLEINITPNRGDCLSHIGVAREVAALFGLTLKYPEIRSVARWENNFGKNVQIDNQVDADCFAYFGAQIRGVKVGPSPSWLRESLEAVGVRSINNIVDITSFVMLEVGQPLHAFDAKKLAAGPNTISIRRGKNGEEFSTISHKKILLSEEDLVIGSGTQAAALAGVMGSDATEVDDSTSDIFLESAVFSAKKVRKTSRKNQLITDASYRFERGIDSERTLWAMQRAIDLILESAGGDFVGANGFAQKADAPAKIRLRIAEVQNVLGKAPEAAKISHILRSLGFRADIAAGEADVLEVGVPSWRNDCTKAIDLIEEIARVWGFENLQAKLPIGALNGDDSQRNYYFQIRRLRRHLTSLGFSEALNLGFTSKAELGRVLMEKELTDLVTIMNPLTVDFSVMKPTLISGLLANVAHNFSRQQKNIRLFEIRKTFHKRPETKKDQRLDTGIVEKLRLAMVVSGADVDQYWQGQEPNADFYSLKGVVDSFLEMLGKGGVEYVAEELPSFFHPGQSASLRVGKRALGTIGRLHPRVEKNWDFGQAVYVAEFELENILQKEISQPSYKAFGKFPIVERDFSATVKDVVQAAQIRTLVTKLTRPLFQDLRFFDVYKGSRIPEGHVSYAFRVHLGASDRTLTDQEVNEWQTKVMQAMEQEFGAKFAGM